MSNDGGVQPIHNCGLGLLQQFFGQFGAGMPTDGNAASTAVPWLAFLADQVARAVAMTQDALENLARAHEIRDGRPLPVIGANRPRRSGRGR